jgi:flagellar biosynthesis protein
MAKKRAVALKYNSEKDSAPTIVASGQGLVAENILKTAAENNVTVQEDSDLAQMLSHLELGSEIPEELYDVVAEIVLFIAEMDEAF